jgi:hypothetical protein
MTSWLDLDWLKYRLIGLQNFSWPISIDRLYKWIVNAQSMKLCGVMAADVRHDRIRQRESSRSR